MRATDLAPAVWNAVADEIRRVGERRIVFFVEVTKVDTQRRILNVTEFGDIGIPLVSFTRTHSYYDTQADGTVQKRSDPDGTNDAFHSQIVLPNVGDTVVVIDLDGTKSAPFCIGVVQSMPGYWGGGSGD